MSAARAGARAAAVLAAAALASPIVAEFEGRVLRAYRDPVGILTACDGDTRNVQGGRTYTEAECDRRLVTALAEHGAGIAECLPDDLPLWTRAAFTSFAYNVGDGAFCRSSMAQAARAGNLELACRRLNERPDGRPQWVFVRAGVDPKTGAPTYKQLPGLVKRRAAERAACERGLST